MPNVMIVFWSRLGHTERLALNAAVGAVQGRANIRLRWLREPSCDPSVPGWKENRERMEKEYIAPRPIDLEWAQSLVLASPARITAGAPEWQTFLSLGSFEGKSVSLLTDASFLAPGWTIVAQGAVPPDDPAQARPYGRRAADACPKGV